MERHVGLAYTPTVRVAKSNIKKRARTGHFPSQAAQLLPSRIPLETRPHPGKRRAADGLPDQTLPRKPTTCWQVLVAILRLYLADAEIGR
jgi:hypothetical protein